MSRQRLLVAALLALGACDGAPAYSPSLPAGRALGRSLPDGFLLGTATAAHQIEGGQHNDWTDWEAGSFPDGRPHVRDGDTSQIAAGSWTRWPDDVAAMRHLGANAYRFSIEWSRLEPAEGQWDTQAEANYRAQLEALRDAGITPVLTIHHYTFPTWVAAKGGWEWRDPQRGISDAMGELAGRLGERFGDLVDLWCTINEPNVAVYDAYLWGDYPPGVQDVVRMAHAYLETMKAHAKMAAALRAHDAFDADGDGRATMVGLAHHVALFDPASASPLDATVAGLTDDVTNELVPRAAATGINSYTRHTVRFDLSDAALSKQYLAPGRPASDLGYENFPEGLYRALVRMSRWGWPIYVLENGVADATGASRPEYLRAHLWALEQAAAAGVDVRGYFHWSLIDNFEWALGYFGRFGLYRVDTTDPTLARTPTQAVETFREIAREIGLKPTP